MRGAMLKLLILILLLIFQSTLPMRGARLLRVFYDNSRVFQSTLPMRGATGRQRRHGRKTYFNPRSPCGERIAVLTCSCLSQISIHAPHAGSDCLICSGSSFPAFQSTLPMRGAIPFLNANMQGIKFQSTLPMRGANFHPNRVQGIFHFNPRSPCGER